MIFYWGLPSKLSVHFCHITLSLFIQTRLEYKILFDFTFLAWWNSRLRTFLVEIKQSKHFVVWVLWEDNFRKKTSIHSQYLGLQLESHSLNLLNKIIFTSFKSWLGFGNHKWSAVVQWIEHWAVHETFSLKFYFLPKGS